MHIVGSMAFFGFIVQLFLLHKLLVISLNFALFESKKYFSKFKNIGSNDVMELKRGFLETFIFFVDLFYAFLVGILYVVTLALIN